jgi:hypothetical protein
LLVDHMTDVGSVELEILRCEVNKIFLVHRRVVIGKGRAANRDHPLIYCRMA